MSNALNTRRIGSKYLSKLRTITPACLNCPPPRTNRLISLAAAVASSSGFAHTTKRIASSTPCASANGWGFDQLRSKCLNTGLLANRVCSIEGPATPHRLRCRRARSSDREASRTSRRRLPRSTARGGRAGSRSSGKRASLCRRTAESREEIHLARRQFGESVEPQLGEMKRRPRSGRQGFVAKPTS